MKKIQANVNLKPSEYEKIKKLAIKNECSISQQLRDLIIKGMDNAK